ITEVDEEVVLAPIYQLQEKIIIIGGSIMAAASVATFVLSRRISHPIQKLRNATSEISKGNFDVQTDIQTNDEIGQLSSSFDSMAKTIKETISAITKRENIIQQQEHILMKYSEEKKECCVCLVDIVGSMTIKESLSDEQSKIYYDTFIKHVSKIVREHNGISVKVVDDSLLFYFPITSEVTSNDAIVCCLDIANSNEILKTNDLPGIAYRISAEIGDVNITKSTTTMMQDIFGEPVNHCFRINPYALPNTVITGESLYRRTKDYDRFTFTSIDQSLIKGLEYAIFIVSAK
ncbi:MAG: HAMP domain-containing protein, partial [Candidatus Nitrosomaritimum yanchengensis]